MNPGEAVMQIYEVMDRLEKCGFAVMIEPMTSRDLVAFAQVVKTSGLHELPPDYQEFLKFSNGLVLDDAVFFSTDSIISCDDDSNFADFINSNKSYRSVRGFKDILVLGVGDHDVFVYDVKRRLYVILDRETHEEIDRFGKFADFLASLIDERRDSMA